MTREEAALIRAWIKDMKSNLGRDQSAWARGYRLALSEFGLVIRAVQDGKTKLKDIG